MPLFSKRCTSNLKLVGKTVIITGCNTGIGRETALDFFKRGGRVIMACRNLEKGAEAKTYIEQKCKKLSDTGVLVIEKLDLNSLQSVRDFAQKMLDTEPQINILVNNAGVMMCPEGKTEDGFDIQFGTNHLAHFLLTMLLLPRMKSSKPARIVTVSSYAHSTRDNINFDDVNYTKNPYSPYEGYVRSKLANVLFSRELASKLSEHNISGVTTYSLHPGAIKTDLGRHFDKTFFWGSTVVLRVFIPFLKTAEQGAQTTIYCAVDAECANQTGLYYNECAIKKPHANALNDEYAKKLWDMSVEFVGLGDYNPFTAPDPGVKSK